MNSRVRSSPSADVIILALAGRQLAAAAHAAGLRPIVVDQFGDTDTLVLAAEYFALPLTQSSRVAVSATRALIKRIQRRWNLPLVWGGGIESYPGLLRALGADGAVMGCDAATVAMLIDPSARAALFRQLKIRHPNCAFSPRAESGWLQKRVGGAGGAHIRDYLARARIAPKHYLQQEMRGIAGSYTFLAHEGGVIGMSVNAPVNLQLHPILRFRYGGSVVSAITAPHQTAIEEIALKLTAHLQLRGLCGIDFIIDPNDQIVVLEVNPRPTATFDLAVHKGDALIAHLSACRGTPIPSLRRHHKVQGHAIVYATDPFQLPKSIDWPDWTADLPQAGTDIVAHAPLCSINAEGSTEQIVRQQLSRRLSKVLTLVGATKKRT